MDIEIISQPRSQASISTGLICWLAVFYDDSQNSIYEAILAECELRQLMFQSHRGARNPESPTVLNMEHFCEDNVSASIKKKCSSQGVWGYGLLKHIFGVSTEP